MARDDIRRSLDLARDIELRGRGEGADADIPSGVDVELEPQGVDRPQHRGRRERHAVPGVEQVLDSVRAGEGSGGSGLVAGLGRAGRGGATGSGAGRDAQGSAAGALPFRQSDITRFGGRTGPRGGREEEPEPLVKLGELHLGEVAVALVAQQAVARRGPALQVRETVPVEVEGPDGQVRELAVEAGLLAVVQEDPGVVAPEAGRGDTRDREEVGVTVLVHVEPQGAAGTPRLREADAVGDVLEAGGVRPEEPVGIAGPRDEDVEDAVAVVVPPVEGRAAGRGQGRGRGRGRGRRRCHGCRGGLTYPEGQDEEGREEIHGMAPGEVAGVRRRSPRPDALLHPPLVGALEAPSPHPAPRTARRAQTLLSIQLAAI